VNRHKVQTGHGSQLPAFPTQRNAATYLGLSEKTIRRYIADGRLIAYRVGPRAIRLDRESVLALARPMGGAA
jgi:excisionase family DNA binding protein